MSGGYFDYTDQIADYNTSEELQCDIESLSAMAKESPLIKEFRIKLDSAKELKAVCRILFDWIADYDKAASYDISFSKLPALTDEHKRKIREVLGEQS